MGVHRPRCPGKSRRLRSRLVFTIFEGDQTYTEKARAISFSTPLRHTKHEEVRCSDAPEVAHRNTFGGSSRHRTKIVPQFTKANKPIARPSATAASSCCRRYWRGKKCSGLSGHRPDVTLAAATYGKSRIERKLGGWQPDLRVRLAGAHEWALPSSRSHRHPYIEA